MADRFVIEDEPSNLPPRADRFEVERPRPGALGYQVFGRAPSEEQYQAFKRYAGDPSRRPTGSVVFGPGSPLDPLRQAVEAQAGGAVARGMGSALKSVPKGAVEVIDWIPGMHRIAQALRLARKLGGVAKAPAEATGAGVSKIAQAKAAAQEATGEDLEDVLKKSLENVKARAKVAERSWRGGRGAIGRRATEPVQEFPVFLRVKPRVPSVDNPMPSAPRSLYSPEAEEYARRALTGGFMKGETEGSLGHLKAMQSNYAKQVSDWLAGLR